MRDCHRMPRWRQAAPPLRVATRHVSAATLDKRLVGQLRRNNTHPFSTHALFPLAKNSTQTRTLAPRRHAYPHTDAPARTARRVWRHRRDAFSSVASSPEEGRGGGLFGVKGLDKASDFPRLAVEAAAEVEQLLLLAVEGDAAGHIRGRALVQILDQMSDRFKFSKSSCEFSTLSLESDGSADCLRISLSICLVMDAAELCRSAHPDTEWKRGAKAAYSILAQLVARLNMVRFLKAQPCSSCAIGLCCVADFSEFLQDKNLYEALVRCLHRASAQNRRAEDELEEEELRVALLLKTDFERGGVHLDDAGRERVMSLQVYSIVSYNFKHKIDT